ncbi:hypothetical protein ACFLXW_00345 [Candidatus Dependentiae bacterium]
MNIKQLFNDACGRYFTLAAGTCIGWKFSLWYEGKGLFDTTLISLETTIAVAVGVISGYMLMQYLNQ